eukprot:Amastigsp_a343124_17.p4 type:complete len:109 gc:universal Amastigsp_a343124_17:253-579(+)
MVRETRPWPSPSKRRLPIGCWASDNVRPLLSKVLEIEDLGVGRAHRIRTRGLVEKIEPRRNCIGGRAERQRIGLPSVVAHESAHVVQSLDGRRVAIEDQSPRVARPGV